MNNPRQFDLNLQTSSNAADEFSFGNDNKFQQSVVRWIQESFSPPYFPGSLIGFLLALITSRAGIELLAAQDGFWVDLSLSRDEHQPGWPPNSVRFPLAGLA